MRRAAGLGLAACCLLALTSCKPDAPKTAAPVRPVLSVVVRPDSERHAGFAGTIQPQYQTDLGFRVLGQIVVRRVGVGDMVHAGQTLAELDPLALDLAVRSSIAEVSRARSQLANAAGAESRTGFLRGRQVSSQADLETAQQGREAAAASAQQAEANLDKMREQRDYVLLKAETDGVVTSTDAEVGQTVASGKKVLTVARLDIREAVIDLPEDVTRSLAVGAPFDIALQTDRATTTTGKIREIAPQADAATRLRRVRITLDHVPEPFRLGATITAVPATLSGSPNLRIPGAALLERDGVLRVWVVDTSAKVVRSVPVEIAGRDEATARIAGGLTAGTRIVVAGVHSLSEGQSITFDDRAAP